jgi:antagonist of KipI
MSLLILKPGLWTTIQDQGRHGYQQHGVRVSGAMDRVAARIANHLLGNHPSAALIEFTLLGPTIRFQQATSIALTGGLFTVRLNEQAISPYQRHHLRPGDQLTIGSAQTGCRGYLAIQGGLLMKPVLGSCSMDAHLQTGDFLARTLASGDEIAYPPATSTSEKTALLLASPVIEYAAKSPLKVIPGPHANYFSTVERTRFVEEPWQIHSESNRMGYRLTGNPLQFEQHTELRSQAVTFGTIQVPPSGQPVILMADHPTTGGYPIIGQVCSADLPRLAQARPGDTIQFDWTTVSVAQSLLREQAKAERQLAHGLRLANNSH